jgi:hypothetical protein
VETNSRNFGHGPTRRDADRVLAACAISAGSHAALVPSHMAHDPQLGLAFVVAVGVLVTKLVESVGLVFALKLNQTVGGRWSLTRQEVAR